MSRIHGKQLMKVMILALLGILILLTGTAGAEKSGTIQELSWVIDDEGKLTVFGQGDMGSGWFSGGWSDYREEITSAVIGDGVTGIRPGAFASCVNMREIILPESVKIIGNGAFNFCNALEKITIPSGVTEIEQDAFLSCQNLKRVTILGPITEISIQVFRGCPKLESVSLPESVTRIGNFAFEDCTGLQEIHLPGKVSTIGDWAFRGCSSLKKIQLPEGLTEIGQRAFEGCSELKDPVLPSTLKKIGLYAFANCVKIAKIRIPDGLSEIGDEAFRECTIQFEAKAGTAGAKALGKAGFSFHAIGEKYQLEYLTDQEWREGGLLFLWADSDISSVKFPKDVKYIGSQAFQNCKKLQSVSIPEGVKEIWGSAFSGCTALKNVHLPESLTLIGVNAFQGCSSLKTLTIPKSVQDIGFEAFKDCHADFYLDVVKGSYAEKYAKENDISYSNGKKKTLSTSAKMHQKINEIISKCIRSGMSEREKALALHDWLIMNNHYDLTYTIHSPEGVLLKGSGVCQSYAEAYSLLCTRAGLANKVLSGQTTSSSSFFPENHAWNLVRIDGRWYHIDCTWDDPVSSTAQVEVDNSPAVSGMERHEYFMLTDDQIKAKRHSWSSEYSADKGKIGRYNEPKFPVNGLDINGNAIIFKNGLYRITGSEAVFVNPTSKSLTSIEIPDQIQISEWTSLPVTEIAENACKDMKKLKTLKIGKNVKKIGAKAFAGCKGLKTITIKSENLTKGSIGKASFKGVPAKATIKIPLKMMKSYKTLLIKAGISKKATFKKN